MNVQEDSLLDEIPGVAQRLTVKVLVEILSLVSLRKGVQSGLHSLPSNLLAGRLEPEGNYERGRKKLRALTSLILIVENHNISK